jgi:hypothetical protein
MVLLPKESSPAFRKIREEIIQIALASYKQEEIDSLRPIFRFPHAGEKTTELS